MKTVTITETATLTGAVEIIHTGPTSTHAVRVDQTKTYCGMPVTHVGSETTIIDRLSCQRCMRSLKKAGIVRVDHVRTTSTIWKATLRSRRMSADAYGVKEISGPALVEVRTVDDGQHTPSYYVFADGEQLFGGFASHLNEEGLPPNHGSIDFIELLSACEGDAGKVRRCYDNGTRYVACAACGADITEADDVFAERTGGSVQRHAAPSMPEVVAPMFTKAELWKMADAGDEGAREALDDMNAVRPAVEREQPTASALWRHLTYDGTTSLCGYRLGASPKADARDCVTCKLTAEAHTFQRYGIELPDALMRKMYAFGITIA